MDNYSIFFNQIRKISPFSLNIIFLWYNFLNKKEMNGDADFSQFLIPAQPQQEVTNIVLPPEAPQEEVSVQMPTPTQFIPIINDELLEGVREFLSGKKWNAIEKRFEPIQGYTKKLDDDGIFAILFPLTMLTDKATVLSWFGTDDINVCHEIQMIEISKTLYANWYDWGLDLKVYGIICTTLSNVVFAILRRAITGFTAKNIITKVSVIEQTKKEGTPNLQEPKVKWQGVT